MWKLFSALTVLTLIVTVWLTYELGIWESRRVEAADKVEGQIQQLEDGLTARNKALNDQEAALKKRLRMLCQLRNSCGLPKEHRQDKYPREQGHDKSRE